MRSRRSSHPASACSPELLSRGSREIRPPHRRARRRSAADAEALHLSGIERAGEGRTTQRKSGGILASRSRNSTPPKIFRRSSNSCSRVRGRSARSTTRICTRTVDLKSLARSPNSYLRRSGSSITAASASSSRLRAEKPSTTSSDIGHASAHSSARASTEMARTTPRCSTTRPPKVHMALTTCWAGVERLAVAAVQWRRLSYSDVLAAVGDLPLNAFEETTRSLTWVEAALRRDRERRARTDEAQSDCSADPRPVLAIGWARITTSSRTVASPDRATLRLSRG